MTALAGKGMPPATCRSGVLLVFPNRLSKSALMTRHLSRTGLARLAEVLIHTKQTRVIA
jgi:hypothetical protein